ncbi:hypothetical protein LTSERUB_0028 [Salmonella enterica subsp. enterica serovar Rubislaw str. A4-653]|uniref:Uncharacterized protein n=1 Tax=Salmonella enterica subsp. enterica serovar Rubislaw str. A4-653 TaxID=913081 RepID=G5QCY0_SALRU|nr:hypothetical protein LTSERUB_0028 [Salmonella enterica subsp. enterica serovar Rubislaw str. A4-653]
MEKSPGKPGPWWRKAPENPENRGLNHEAQYSVLNAVY